jgi:hypothetical protein
MNRIENWKKQFAIIYAGQTFQSWVLPQCETVR